MTDIFPIPFGKRYLGPGHPAVIIAEIGINHEGSVETCALMIEAAVRAGADAVIAACRPQPGHCVRQLLFFETPSSTEWRPPAPLATFLPNWFTDISESLTLKLQAMEAYKSELRDFPHPRSLAAVEHLARWHGASVGLAAAEAFALGRSIISEYEP